MKEQNVLNEKSYQFAIRIVKLYQFLKEEKKEFTLSKQILRAGTSIGANVEEATGAQSEKDFYSKVNIAYKEARETHYWLRLLYDTNYIDEKQFNSIIIDCDELLKISGTIIKTMKSKLFPNS
ncbi:MAG: four helix bundle protein [Ignavibacteria bacterium CG_4_8_14_3_um_filter_37_9]|nr:MAG: four helix bundle protein [Ignavibacteria bacterium CG_4_8_14_3_um_filter_37_9]